jgi:hypothetical protein
VLNFSDPEWREIERFDVTHDTDLRPSHKCRRCGCRKVGRASARNLANIHVVQQN